MLIKWFGHAAFLLSSRDQTRVIIDPYHVAPDLKYRPINESADIVTQSHDHGDHNNSKAIKGNPVILNQPGSQTVKGISIKAVQAYHDAVKGSQRGKDLIFCFNIDGVKLCHLGDLGHQLNSHQISEIGPIDVLFVPVGGFFTIDAAEASAVAQSLQVKMIFPMHYKTAGVDLPIQSVEVFLRDKKNVRRVDSSEIEIESAKMPKETEIIVLQPAN
jgi:L-ascorbate metabolism protein UlaG (beta-lactamase superfamily)